jgi:hypothetical protein
VLPSFGRSTSSPIVAVLVLIVLIRVVDELFNRLS